eukprot:2374938-Amphidinium_carterae.1
MSLRPSKTCICLPHLFKEMETEPSLSGRSVRATNEDRLAILKWPWAASALAPSSSAHRVGELRRSSRRSVEETGFSHALPNTARNGQSHLVLRCAPKATGRVRTLHAAKDRARVWHAQLGAPTKNFMTRFLIKHPLLLRLHCDVLQGGANTSSPSALLLSTDARPRAVRDTSALRKIPKTTQWSTSYHDFVLRSPNG